MSPHPIDQDIRRRLIEAQRAEADALKAVELAARARDRSKKKFADAQAELDTAKVALVECSGVERAALLLAEEVAALRRLRRPNGTALAAAEGPDRL